MEAEERIANLTDKDLEDARNRAAVLAALVEHRKLSGLRQVDVAARMGVGQPSVSEFERGEVSPRLSTLQRYARAVGLELKVEIAEDVLDGH